MSCSAAVSVISTTRRLAISGLPLQHALIAPQPGAVGRGEAGDVEAEADVRMGRDLLDRALQHVAVDEADEAELLDERHELAGGNDAAVVVDHAQQAFVVIDGARVGVDHRLIGEDTGGPRASARCTRSPSAMPMRCCWRCSSERR